LACVVCIAATWLVAGAAPASAFAPAPVAIKSSPLGQGFDDMVVDAVGKKIFISDADTSQVFVRSFDGDDLGHVAGLPGAAEMTLVGRLLYIGLSTGAGIAVIDADSLARKPDIATAISGVRTVAFAAGRLWTRSGACDNTDDQLTRIDLDTGKVTAYETPPDAWAVTTCGVFRENAGDTNLLFAFSTNGTPVIITRLDVSVDPPTFKTVRDDTGIHDDAVAEPGSRTMLLPSSTRAWAELDPDTLAITDHVYEGDDYPFANDVTAAGGGLVAGGVNAGYDNWDVYLWHAHDKTPIMQWRDRNRHVPAQGIKFSPDGTRLFVVMNSDVGYFNPVLDVIVSSGPIPPGFTAVPPRAPSLYVGEAKVWPDQRISTYSSAQVQHLFVHNSGDAPAHITAIRNVGGNPDDWDGDTDCVGELAIGAECKINIYFFPGGFGHRTTTLEVVDDAPDGPQRRSLVGTGVGGYWIAGSRGSVDTDETGDAGFYGDMYKKPLAAPMVSMAATRNGEGYWLLGGDGGIFTFGNATFFGSTGGMRLTKPVVAIASTRTSKGYWLVASDGGIFAFGDAGFFGSTGAITLNKPIVAMAATPSGKGYWLVASDGGIFAFGDAAFLGSTGGVRLNKPIVAMASTGTGKGYWLVASDGGIFSFGDAAFYGSTGAIRLQQPIVGVAASPTGHGYWLVAKDGGVFTFGDVPYYGSIAGLGYSDVVGIVPTTWSMAPWGSSQAARSTKSFGRAPTSELLATPHG
jgi:hypothetical protein